MDLYKKQFIFSMIKSETLPLCDLCTEYVKSHEYSMNYCILDRKNKDEKKTKTKPQKFIEINITCTIKNSHKTFNNDKNSLTFKRISAAGTNSTHDSQKKNTLIIFMDLCTSKKISPSIQYQLFKGHAPIIKTKLPIQPAIKHRVFVFPIVDVTYKQNGKNQSTKLNLRVQAKSSLRKSSQIITSKN